MRALENLADPQGEAYRSRGVQPPFSPHHVAERRPLRPLDRDDERAAAGPLALVDRAETWAVSGHPRHHRGLLAEGGHEDVIAPEGTREDPQLDELAGVEATGEAQRILRSGRQRLDHVVSTAHGVGNGGIADHGRSCCIASATGRPGNHPEIVGLSRHVSSHRPARE